MTRHRPTPDTPLDPVVAAELDALERVLAGDDAADPVLAALVRDVRRDAPPMTAAFARDLDARVEAGFPRERGPLAPGAVLARLRGTRVAWRPVLAVGAPALAALVVALAIVLPTSEDRTASSFGDDPDVAMEAGGEGAAMSQAPEAAREIAPAPDAQEDSVVASPAPPVSPSGVAPATPDPGRLGGERRVERSADLTLRARPDDVQAVADRVVRTVQGLGGVVASARVSSSEDGGEAGFDLRVPASRLDRAIRELSALADVVALSQAADDITGTFTSAQDRLTDARDERAALLRALGRATTDRQVASLRARIADSRSRIARIEGELRGLRARTDRATVALTIVGSADADRDSGDDGAGGGPWSPADALDDAVRVLEVAAGVTLVALAVLLPLGLLALLGLVTARSARRRARERALDGAPAAG